MRLDRCALLTGGRRRLSWLPRGCHLRGEWRGGLISLQRTEGRRPHWPKHVSAPAPPLLLALTCPCLAASAVNSPKVMAVAPTRSQRAEGETAASAKRTN